MEEAKIKTTLGELQAFFQTAKMYLNQKDLKPSHLSLAISKTVKSITPALDDLSDDIAEKRIDLAQKDKSGVIILNENGSYQMKAESAKKFQVAMRKLLDKTIEVTVYRAKTVPSNLPLPWYDTFVPFVIKDYPTPVEEDQPEE